MKITFISILFSLVALVAIFQIFKKIKNENIGFRSGLIWLIIWITICFFSIFPDTLYIAMKLANMGNRVLFVLVLAVFILLAIVFNQSSKMDSMSRTLSKLAREIAILDYKVHQKNIGKDTEDE